MHLATKCGSAWRHSYRRDHRRLQGPVSGTAMRVVPTEQVPRALAIFNGGDALATVICSTLGIFPQASAGAARSCACCRSPRWRWCGTGSACGPWPAWPAGRRVRKRHSRREPARVIFTMTTGIQQAMTDSELDNPFWASLRSRHRAVALGVGEVARYPAAFAPFLGVASAAVDADAAIAALVEADETVYLLGVAPQPPQGWALSAQGSLAQMICASPVSMVAGPMVTALSAPHRADVLALTALVYPHYFRPCTMELGRYFGIYQDGRLVAMAGERLGMDAWQEISAVCTHPDFTGRGYAHRLLAWLSNDNLERGRTPFLHVSHANPHALHLYERIGYRLRRDIPFWSLHRVQV